ncbi:DUF5777 family beta-barrel protein [Marinoscillum sp.]|uniref:DUF5777 family beta-barrel protein n=1 Tax=Marinoscillum sp. TaxID=2024838 RepID=UPI003BAC1CE2
MIRTLFTCILLLLIHVLTAQDDLLADLQAEEEPTQNITTATFKGTRIINGHSIETRDQGTLEFIISHRFGTVNSGAYQFWGLDQSNIRLALEYALTDRLMAGLGRSSFEKTFDGFVKYRVLQQQTGVKKVPVSITWFSSATIKTLKRFDGYPIDFTDRMAVTHQALIARKITPALSLQITPSYTFYELVEENETSDHVWALGVGGRMKVSKRVTINAEYFPQLVDKGSQYLDAFAIGVDIETGGHVFQLQLTNATAMIEKGFIGETTNDFFNGDIHFGFNISRAFQIGNRDR